MTELHEFRWPNSRSLQRWMLGAGGTGLTLSLAGVFVDAKQFFRSYLMAFTFWLGISLGSLGIWLIHNMTGGWWGMVIRRVLEAAMGTLPLMVVAFVPLVFGLQAVYFWAGSEHSGDHHFNELYLNVPFFLGRAAFYFAVWLTLAYVLNRWSKRQDETGDARIVRWMQVFSGPAAVAYGLTLTFAAVDWLMSLTPGWYSSIFSAVVATSQALPALAFAIAMAAIFGRRPPCDTIVTPEIWNDLGNLLLAFVMLWCYMSFSQLLLIWSGNLPEEIPWYLMRSDGGWQWIGAIFVVFYFALPFFLLLSRDIKRRPERLGKVAWLIVAISLMHHFWLVAPAFSPGRLQVHWLDLTTVVGLGGLWLAWFFWILQSRPLIPVHDSLAQQSLNHA